MRIILTARDGSVLHNNIIRSMSAKALAAKGELEHLVHATRDGGCAMNAMQSIELNVLWLSVVTRLISH